MRRLASGRRAGELRDGDGVSAPRDRRRRRNHHRRPRYAPRLHELRQDPRRRARSLYELEDPMTAALEELAGLDRDAAAAIAVAMGDEL